MSDTATLEAPAPQAKPNRKLFPGQLVTAEYHRGDHVAMPEAGTTLKEMTDPAYWAHVARTVRPWDRIEVRPKDGTWWAELLVRAVEPFTVVVHVLRSAEFNRPAALEPLGPPDGYEFQSKGSRGWAVIRTSDKQTLQQNLPTEEAAGAWLHAYLRKVAA